MRHGNRDPRAVRSLWTAVIGAVVLWVFLVPAMDAVGALLLAPKMHALAVRVFAVVLWVALVGAAWSYRDSSDG